MTPTETCNDISVFNIRYRLSFLKLSIQDPSCILKRKLFPVQKCFSTHSGHSYPHDPIVRKSKQTSQTKINKAPKHKESFYEIKPNSENLSNTWNEIHPRGFCPRLILNNKNVIKSALALHLCHLSLSSEQQVHRKTLVSVNRCSISIFQPFSGCSAFLQFGSIKLVT